MIDRNSRDAIIMNMTADAVSLQETTAFISFQQAIISSTPGMRSAEEITTLSGIIVIWKRRQLDDFGNVG